MLIVENVIINTKLTSNRLVSKTIFTCLPSLATTLKTVAQFDGSKLPLNDVKPRSRNELLTGSSASLVGKFDSSNDKLTVTPLCKL